MRWKKQEVNNNPDLNGVKRRESECGDFVVAQIDGFDYSRNCVVARYIVEVHFKMRNKNLFYIIHWKHGFPHIWKEEESAKKFVHKHFGKPKELK